MKKSPPKPKARARVRVTIHDVARQAGVSIYTVSRTLNNVPGVNPETRERVLDLCRQLNMRPRPVAKRKHFALVIQKKDRADPAGYTAMLAFQLLAEVSARQMALSLFTEDDCETLQRMLFDGILAVTWDDPTIEMLSTLKETPIVVLNRFSLTSRFHVVGWDHTAEGRTVAEYLLGLGHKRLAFVAEPPAHWQSTQNRLASYRAACDVARHPLKSNRIELLETRGQLALALSRIMASGADAIYAPAQGRLGPEVAQILQCSLKVRIPEDISLVCGEHSGWSSLFTPPLTTVDAPLELLARRSVDHLLALIDKRPAAPAEVLLDTPIIERKSVCDRRGRQSRNDG
ncbi:MAG: LacI family transcriptional regulator [Opitutaceae bacterium]|jgi:LacI family transcriptional regulator|nr:LacI family transcriptional regulator [Opitutaceae bacterium]